MIYPLIPSFIESFFHPGFCGKRVANCYKDLSLDLNVVIVSGVLKTSGIEILAGLLSD